MSKLTSQQKNHLQMYARRKVPDLNTHTLDPETSGLMIVHADGVLSLIEEANEKHVILVAAAAIVSEDGEKLLLTKRNQPALPEAHGRWELPGGRVEFGESVEEACIREIREELGVMVVIDRMLPHAQSSIYSWPDGHSTHAIVLAYQCHIDPYKPPVASDDTISEVSWFYLPSISREANVLRGTHEFAACIRQAQANERFERAMNMEHYGTEDASVID